MQQPMRPPAESNPPLPQRDRPPQGECLRVEHLQNPTGEGTCCSEDAHTLFVSLSPRPIRYVQSQDGKTYEGAYRPGEFLITPAQVPLSVRWEGEESCLQIQLPIAFLQTVVSEVLERDRLQLVPEFQVRNAQIEAIAMLLLAESQHRGSGSRLYLDSLANALAIDLLRHHATARAVVPVYAGGLSSRQLDRVLDYINAHLEEAIALEQLAQLLDLSQFHFSRLFKQSVGLSPYQYLLRQRVERAKELLKQTNRPISDIAFECGFNSHSHLSKQFRQVTGVTPKTYRKQ